MKPLQLSASATVGKTLKEILLKANDIEAVLLVTYTEEAYRKHISYFLDAFIGKDQQNVKIKNQRSLKFGYDKKKETASGESPENINNRK